MDWFGSGSISSREQAERIIAETIRRVKLEARNDPVFVPPASDVSTILAGRHFVLPPPMQERSPSDATDLLANRVFQHTDVRTQQGTSLNVPNTLVQRDANGDFAASVVQVKAIKATTQAGYDLIVYEPNGTTVIFRVPTGTGNVEMVTGWLGVQTIRATASVDLDITDEAGTPTIHIPSGTNDVEINNGFLTVAQVAGNAATATALAGAAPAVTGSRGGNAALASLLTQLASRSLIVDTTTL